MRPMVAGNTDWSPLLQLSAFLRSILCNRHNRRVTRWYKHNSKPVDKSRIIFETINMWITFVTRNSGKPHGPFALCLVLMPFVGRD